MERLKAPYRVEQDPDTGKWNLYLRNRETGLEYLFHAYNFKETAIYDGVVATSRRPTTDDGMRARRRALRAGT